MISAQYSDKAFIVNLLSKAFDNNGSVNYVIKQDKNREKRIRNLMEYSFKICYNYGQVYLSNDRKAVCLLLPGKKKTTLKTVFWDIQLVFNCLGVKNIFKVLDREKEIAKHYPEKFIYLWYLAVDVAFQRQAYGSSLLQEVIELSKNQNFPIFLETSMSENLPFYQKHGFFVYKELMFNKNLYMLKYE